MTQPTKPTDIIVPELIRDASSYFETTGEMPVITAEQDPLLNDVVAHIEGCATCRSGVACPTYDAFFYKVTFMEIGGNNDTQDTTSQEH